MVQWQVRIGNWVAPGPQLQGETKPCWACRKPMPIKALKCLECDEHQGIRRFLSFSAAILGLLVALVSVTGFAAPGIVKAFGPHRGIPNSALVGISLSDGEVSFVAGNSGDEPLALESAHLSASQSGDGQLQQAFILELVDLEKPGDRIVPPKGLTAFHAVLLDQGPENRAFSMRNLDTILRSERAGMKVTCRLTVLFVTTKGEFAPSDSVVQCPMLRSLGPPSPRVTTAPG